MTDQATDEFADSNFVAIERGYINTRRGGDVPWPAERITGLALSGGGIRSATFCVGFLQTLSKRGLFPSIDYLSTVSGGSYAGSFFGSLFVDAKSRGDGTPDVEHRAFDPVHPLHCPRGTEAIRRLRDMGRYLTPSGTSDAFYGGAVVARNWVAVQFVIGMAALLLFWVMHRLDAVVRDTIAPPRLPMTPALEFAAIVMLGATLACGNAYWLTRRDYIPERRRFRIGTNLVVLALLAVFAYCLLPWLWSELLGDWTLPPEGFTVFVASIAGGALALIVRAEWKFGKLELAPAGTAAGENLPGFPETTDPKVQASLSEARTKQRAIAAEDKVRSALSRWMALCLTLTLTAAGLAIIDNMGDLAYRSAYDLIHLPQGKVDYWKEIKDAWPILVTVFPPLASYVANRGLKNRSPPTDPGNVDTQANWAPTLIVVFGATTLAVWLVLWSAVATGMEARLAHIANSWKWMLALLIVLNVGQSLCFSFINLSSLSDFYASRLRRAYIGASSWGNRAVKLSEDDPQDTIRIHDYYDAGIANGAPLHLINVTVAETVADGSNLVARDRKGKPMHVSPAGMAYEGHKPGTIVTRLRDLASGDSQGEELPLANWVAISGAAVSAAIGSGTSLGTSILATMANVRLGYWWRSKLAHGPRAAIWADRWDFVQNYLFLELRGKFTGTMNSRWYLTDGGHFENTGVYPLLQRKVPFIIACDNGADPKYRLDDVMRLVGRSRTDLGVSITFLDEAALAKKLGRHSPVDQAIGTLDALQRRGSPAEPGGPIAALATIDYGGGCKGLLLLVKPKLAFSEPPEVLAYHGRAAEFPQQTTGDQFFDEEQWEAYRRLGEIAGERLFPEKRPASASGWLPYDSLGVDPGRAARPGLRGRMERLLGR